MELSEVLDRHYRKEADIAMLHNETQRHSALLGESISQHFLALRAILARHEGTMRHRWERMRRLAREELLLKAWPEMPRNHRTDLELSCRPISATRCHEGTPSEELIWPYLNLEDLSKQARLLVYLNALGRHIPWTFVRTELDFSPYLRLPICQNCFGGEPHSIMCRFTKELSPTTYGSVVYLEAKHDSELGKNYFDVCPWLGLQLLQVQEKIYSFLVACSLEMLHHLVQNHKLMDSPMLDEPILSEILLRGNGSYTSTTHTIQLSPYRPRTKVDFSRSNVYLEALYNNAKDHIWSLREDPSYMADNIIEAKNHSLDWIKDAQGRTHSFACTDRQQYQLVKDVLHTAYTKVWYWHFLCQEFKIMCDIFEEDVSRDWRRLYHAVCGFRALAGNMHDVLTCEIRHQTWAAPKMRDLYVRSGSEETMGYVIHERDTEDLETSQWMKALYLFDPRIKHKPTDKFLYIRLDTIDTLIRNHQNIKGMLTSFISESISELSVVAECLFQLSLWLRTPEVELLIDSNTNYQFRPQEHDFADYSRWMLGLYEYPPAIRLLSGTAIQYPIDEKLSSRNVNIRRAAEANLDQFWRDVDRFMIKETKTAQHCIIRDCLSGRMRRTNGSAREGVVIQHMEHTHVPSSRLEEDSHEQTTTKFSKASVREQTKSKIKTRGVASTDLLVEHGPRANDPLGESNTTIRIFFCDRKSFKVFKTLFGMTQESPDVISGFIKWTSFTYAMTKIGFSAEKLQGSAWQFTLNNNTDVERSIHFHEPHPESDIPYVMARRFGRRLERVYGWSGDMFQLA